MTNNTEKCDILCHAGFTILNWLLTHRNWHRNPNMKQKDERIVCTLSLSTSPSWFRTRHISRAHFTVGFYRIDYQTHELLAHSAHSTLVVVRPIYAEWKPVHVASIEHCAAWPSPSWVAKCLGRWRAVTGFELILWSTSRVSTLVLTLHLHPIVKRLTSVKQPGSKTTATLSRTVSFHETSKL